MYQLSYAETAIDNQRDCRDRERRAMEHAISLFEKAGGAGPRSPEAEHALSFACALWKALIADLVAPENDLPEALRADLVSVGVWIIKEAESIRAGKSQSFLGLTEVCSMIRDGLK
jgi:flagellar protein FlaF